MAGSRDEMRASDADRAAAGEVLRAALDEGRLDFHEYDERLRDAYAAKTYGELNRLLADLPARPPAPAARSQVVPLQDAQPATVPLPAGSPDLTRRWLLATWDDYLGAVAICVGIWAVIAVMGGGWWYFWPVWVAGPWGAVLLVQTVRGLASGEPQRWAEKKARQAEKKARKIEKRRREQGRLTGLDGGQGELEGGGADRG
jgi:hypothetical protein